MSDVHPDDEALSAHLDGQGSVGQEAHEQDSRLRAHLDGCATCAARLEELQRVRTLLGAPVPPPPPWQRDAAIARALDAGGHREGRRRSGAWAGGIAAATLLVLGAAIGLSQLTNGNGDQLATTGAKASAPASEAADQSDGSAGPPTADAVSELGDLGALTDTAALRALVQPTLAQLHGTAAPTAERLAPDAGQQFRSGAKQSTTVRRCADAARALDPANVRPAAAGIATWQGTPAEVFVYAVEGRPGAARVYVLARSDCRVLEFQSYAP